MDAKNFENEATDGKRNDDVSIRIFNFGFFWGRVFQSFSDWLAVYGANDTKKDEGGN